MRQKSFQILTPTILLAVVIFHFLTLPIEKSFNFLISSWTKYLITIPLICILTILTKWTKGSFIRKVLVILTIILITYSRNISERLFLGKQIAYTYLGQDAGFEELYLFNNGKCKLTYGGIFGVNENHYGTFEIRDTVILVDTKARLLDLQGFSIKFDNSNFTIQPQ